MTDLSKKAQVARSPGGNRKCPDTGRLKADCDCPRCKGWRNAKKGRRGQAKARRALDLKPERFAGRLGNEESWNASNLRVEVKSGAQVNPIARLYVEARNQSDAKRPIGDNRPFTYVAVPDGSSPLVVFRADDLREAVYALVEEWAAVRGGVE